jgi:hypothetical protein
VTRIALYRPLAGVVLSLGFSVAKRVPFALPWRLDRITRPCCILALQLDNSAHSSFIRYERGGGGGDEEKRLVPKKNSALVKRHSRVDILYRRTTLLPRWLCLERPFLLPFLYFLNSIPRSSRYYCITYIYISRIYACIPVDSLSEAWGGQKPKPVEYPLKHSEKKPVLSRSVVEVLGIFNSETFPLKISNHNLCFFFLLSISIRSVDKTNF